MTEEQQAQIKTLVSQMLAWGHYNEILQQGFEMPMETQQDVFPATLEVLQQAASWLADAYGASDEELESIVIPLKESFQRAQEEHLKQMLIESEGFRA